MRVIVNLLINYLRHGPCLPFPRSLNPKRLISRLIVNGSPVKSCSVPEFYRSGHLHLFSPPVWGILVPSLYASQHEGTLLSGVWAHGGWWKGISSLPVWYPLIRVLPDCQNEHGICLAGSISEPSARGWTHRLPENSNGVAGGEFQVHASCGVLPCSL